MQTLRLSREQYIKLYIPDTAVEVAEGSDLAVVYTYANESGKLVATAFIRKQAKPAWCYRFNTVEKRDVAIADLFRSVRAHGKAVETTRAERAAGHKLQPGDTVFSSWGYDQTNVDWYRVSRATDFYVWLAPLNGIETEDWSGAMSGFSSPGELLKKPEKKCKAYGDRVTIDRYSGFKWDGKPRSYSSYA